MYIVHDVPTSGNACSSKGSSFQISTKKRRLDMNAMDVLEILGKNNYRVVGFTAGGKMVWTLELKDFEI